MAYWGARRRSYFTDGAARRLLRRGHRPERRRVRVLHPGIRRLLRRRPLGRVDPAQVCLLDARPSGPHGRPAGAGAQGRGLCSARDPPAGAQVSGGRGAAQLRRAADGRRDGGLGPVPPHRRGRQGRHSAGQGLLPGLAHAARAPGARGAPQTGRARVLLRPLPQEVAPQGGVRGAAQGGAGKAHPGRRSDHRGVPAGLGLLLGRHDDPAPAAAAPGDPAEVRNLDPRGHVLRGTVGGVGRGGRGQGAYALRAAAPLHRGFSAHDVHPGALVAALRQGGDPRVLRSSIRRRTEECRLVDLEV
mmetsp:Transcript_1469/g.4429  ORF Transcript_1469/g.4429 Transcript_1469/m.4429 type:complete len:302 (+) Transcript_1469:784-1689(+)